jgi:hypothetical protein
LQRPKAILLLPILAGIPDEDREQMDVEVLGGPSSAAIARLIRRLIANGIAAGGSAEVCESLKSK